MAKQDKVAIITGSTKGIGKGIAQELANQGIKTIITSRVIPIYD